MASSSLQLKRWYRDYNRRYFDDSLPHDLIVLWEPCDDADALTYILGNTPTRIAIDPSYSRSPRAARILLLHEMVHVEVIDPMHGQRFRRRLKHLIHHQKAFDRLL